MTNPHATEMDVDAEVAERLDALFARDPWTPALPGENGETDESQEEITRAPLTRQGIQHTWRKNEQMMLIVHLPRKTTYVQRPPFKEVQYAQHEPHGNWEIQANDQRMLTVVFRYNNQDPYPHYLRYHAKRTSSEEIQEYWHATKTESWSGTEVHHIYIRPIGVVAWLLS